MWSSQSNYLLNKNAILPTTPCWLHVWNVPICRQSVSYAQNCVPVHCPHCCFHPGPGLISMNISVIYFISRDQRFSNYEAGELQGDMERERERWEPKILHEVKETGACHCSKNNRKLVIVVWSADLARSPTRSAVRAAALAVSHTSWMQLKYFKTVSAWLPRFAS